MICCIIPRLKLSIVASNTYAKPYDATCLRDRAFRSCGSRRGSSRHGFGAECLPGVQKPPFGFKNRLGNITHSLCCSGDTGMNQTASMYQLPATTEQSWRCAEAREIDVLADVYRTDVNIAIWQRQLDHRLAQAADNILVANSALQVSQVVTPQDTQAVIERVLGATTEASALSEDIAQLVDMFCCLFELERVGLRLSALDGAMCPRFHVDRVPCRLVTTYQGVGTEWLPHPLADRSRLGRGNRGKPDEQSGLLNSLTDIQQLGQGDVALLKGEIWEGNQGAGIIHRSPLLTGNARRMLLTLDFIED